MSRCGSCGWFIGFDSAWTDKATAPGAICAVAIGGGFPAQFHPPRLASFDGALKFISNVRSDSGCTLIALDQPTVVPDDVLDTSTAFERGQWNSQARVFGLNPVGRRQTKKRRALVPVSDSVGEWLDTIQGPICRKEPSKATWRRMQAELGIPF
jgi:hypothetical protein